MIDSNLAIQTINLSKKFNKFIALDNLNIAVEPNTIYGFLGPNGSGKTTAIRLLAGLSHPTDGHSYVYGYESFAKDMQVRRLIGYLPDVPSFFSFMSGLQYLTFCGQIFGLEYKVSQKQAYELLEMTGIKEAAHRNAVKYSRGMKQRLGLAAALVGNPKVVFLDEPVSALDPIGRADILDIIKSLKEKTTVFLSTHILNDAERVCDKVGIINNGTLLVSQSVDDLKKSYSKNGFEIRLKEEPIRALPVIHSQEWCEKIVSSFEVNGDYIMTVYVTNTIKAAKELQQILSTHEYALASFNAIRVSLEDAFIKLTGDKSDA
ncbi:MAG: ABC transporter ATP-binding protein [Chloroflexi bacterium]|nr:ABC transporter ATP-binding protein [Chloroflexota bacterium]